MKKGKKRIVVALGGNALGNTPQEQISQVALRRKSLRIWWRRDMKSSSDTVMAPRWVLSMQP